MICKVEKHFQGGSWTMYARLPKGARLTHEQWKDQQERWGEATNGGHAYGYRMYVRGVRKAPEDAKWLEFSEDILLRTTGATKGRASPSSPSSRARSRASNAASVAASAPAPSGSGMLPATFAPGSSPLGVAGKAARSTRKSSTVGSARSWPRRSAPAVAAPSTAIERGCCGLPPTHETVVCLVAFLLGILRVTYSGDKVALATLDARKAVRGLDVSPEEFERVRMAVVERWLGIEASSPLRQALGSGGDPNA